MSAKDIPTVVVPLVTAADAAGTGSHVTVTSPGGEDSEGGGGESSGEVGHDVSSGGSDGGAAGDTP